MGGSFPFCQENAVPKWKQLPLLYFCLIGNLFCFGIAIYTLWQPLMAQIVDLGCHSFKTDCLRGQCLVSRATAMLTRSDSTNATEPTDHKLDFQNAWITLKQELIVDLYMGADSNPVMSMPCFVKQVVETVQASLVSSSKEACHHLTNTITRLNRFVTVRISKYRRYITNIAA